MLIRVPYNQQLNSELKQLGARYVPAQKAWQLPDQRHLEQYIHLLIHRQLPVLSAPQLPDDISISIPGAKPYQAQAIQYLISRPNIRHLLADDMGLGKTYQAIQVIKCRKLSAIIVCPNSLKFNWQAEFHAFAPNYTCFVVDGTSKQRKQAIQDFIAAPVPKTLIIHYEGLRLYQDELLAIPNTDTILIVDEAHRLKNPKSQQSKVAKALAQRFPHLLLLTGTPVKNRPDELWHLLHLIDPKEFSSYWRFIYIFCDISDTPFGQKITGLRQDTLPLLNNIFSQYAIRRTKAEVLQDLPEKIRTNTIIKLSNSQQKLYKQIKDDFVAVLSDKQQVPITSVVAQIMRLRQVCLDPELLKPVEERTPLDVTLPKVKALLDIIEDNPDSKIIVFTNFAQFAERLYRYIYLSNSQPFKAVLVTGAQTPEERQQAVEKFQTDRNTKIFVGTIGAAGVGLTLTAGNIVVFMDKAWSPADNEQAEDRVYRIGQTMPVNIISLIAAGTVEEKIEKLLDKKQKIFSDIVDCRTVSMLL